MASLVKIDFTDFGPMRVIGKEIKVNLGEGINPIPQFWERCFEDGTFQILESMANEVAIPAYIGWEGEYDPDSKTFTYIVGMFMNSNTNVPEGFTFRDLPESKMAIAWIKGEEPEIYMQATELTMRAMEENGYVYDYTKGYMVEVYTEEHFVAPMNRGEKEIILDFYVPCKVK